MLGAAVVSSWEVALTDLSRALRGRISDAKQAELIERMSDALVPTESPFSGAGKRFSHAVKMATKAALESGRLEDATHPLGEAVGVLGSAVAQGWPKTVGHMEPLIEALGQPDQTRASLLELGPRMQSALDDAWRGYVVELETLGQCPDLEQGLIDALESWKDEAIRAMEVLLYESRTVLVDAAEAVTESV